MTASALVIGAGPAGLSAALGFLRSGIRTTIVDQRRTWSDRVCGSFLDLEAVRSLEWLGLNEVVLASPAVPAPLIEVSTGRSILRLPSGSRGRTAWAVPRRHLEERMISEVEQRGGEIRWGERAIDVRRSDRGWAVSVRRGRDDAAPETAVMEADYLVHADGRFSPAADRAPESDQWFGWNARFSDADHRPGEMSLYFYRAGYVGLLTFADGSTNVCGLVRRNLSQGGLDWQRVFDEARAEQPHLRKRLAHANRSTPWRGVGPLPFSFRSRFRPGVFLAGDAAGVGDPFMGEGNGRALAAGPMIAEVLAKAPTPEAAARRYASLWDATYRKRLQTGLALRWLLTHPSLGRPAIAAFAAWPAAARRLTPLFHSGFNAPPAVCPVDIL